MTCSKSVLILPYLVKGSVALHCGKAGQGNDCLHAAQSRKEEELLLSKPDPALTVCISSWPKASLLIGVNAVLPPEQTDRCSVCHKVTWI